VIQRTSREADLCEMQFRGERNAGATGDRAATDLRHRAAAGTVEFASGSKSHEGSGIDRPIPPCVSET